MSNARSIANFIRGLFVDKDTRNVGLGTDTPEEALHIAKGANSAIRLGAAGGDFAYRLRANVSSSVNGGFKIEDPVSGDELYRVTSGASGSHRFYVNNTERARIDSAGDLLVGTTSLSSASRGSRISSGNATSSAGVSTSWDHLNFLNTNGQVGAIITSGSSTTYSTSSDYRLKESIAPMTGALEKVQALNPVTYTWKADGSAGQGFIAHELQEVCPDAVTGEKDAVDEEGNPQYQGVDTSFLVGILAAAIKEQQAIIEDLKARIEALESPLQE
jgi:hypothetical protein